MRPVAVVAMVALLCGVRPLSGSSTDDWLLPYAVHIVRTPAQSWPGYGVYLGRGLVLTAAHVVDHAATTKPRVVVAGLELPSQPVKEGSFDAVDLTLLRIDDQDLPISIRTRRMTLCHKAPWPGEEVISVIPERAVRSRVASPTVLPENARRFDTIVSDVATTGNSGSGVFDDGEKCLLGIMSRKFERPATRYADGQWHVEREAIAKYFVPAGVIARFMPQ